MSDEKTITHQQLTAMCAAIGVDSMSVDRVVITPTQVEIQHIERDYVGDEPRVTRTTEVRQVRG